jgi:hypothetical protein
MNPTTLTLLLRGLDLLVLGIEVAPEIRNTFTTITEDVSNMLAEGRVPTPAEWARLDTLRDQVHQRIKEAHHNA